MLSSNASSAHVAQEVAAALAAAAAGDKYVYHCTGCKKELRRSRQEFDESKLQCPNCKRNQRPCKNKATTGCSNAAKLKANGQVCDHGLCNKCAQTRFPCACRFRPWCGCQAGVGSENGRCKQCLAQCVPTIELTRQDLVDLLEQGWTDDALAGVLDQPSSSVKVCRVWNFWAALHTVVAAQKWLEGTTEVVDNFRPEGPKLLQVPGIKVPEEAMRKAFTLVPVGTALPAGCVGPLQDGKAIAEFLSTVVDVRNCREDGHEEEEEDE